MANLKPISAALKLTDTKKENLRKAFDNLQSHFSSLSSSSSLSWTDLDSHFTSLQSTLEHKFNILQSQKPQSPSPPEQKPPSSPITVKNSSESATVMKSLCEEMNGLGLRRYIGERSKERDAIRNELPDALRSAPDAAAMVLDAMEGFYVLDSKGDNDKELCALRSWCLILLEGLRVVEPEIKPEVRERANNLAVEWKGKACLDGGNPNETWGFLNLLVSYGLVGGFDMDELIEFAVVAASTRYSQAIKLCHNLGFGDRISDLIQKLISKGKQLPAVKFIFEFGLAGKFPPVPLLKDYVKESKKSAQNVRNDANSNRKALIGATMKEISALQVVIKYIEDYKLESEYPKENLIKRIGKLRKDKEIGKQSRPQKKKPKEASGSKRPRITAPAGQLKKEMAMGRQSRPQKRKPQEDSGSKRPRTTAPAGPAATPSSVTAQRPIAPPHQQPHLRPAGSLPEHPALYSSLPAGPYGLVAPTNATGPTPAFPPYGSTPAVPPYQGSSGGLYGFAGSPMVFSGNVTPTGSHQCPLPSAYSIRPVAFIGYGLPQQYHPSYYPQ